MDLFRQDLRYAVRRLVASPGFTTVAILSLALGIGANTAIFSIVNAVLLRRSPAEDRERLVEVYTSDDDGIVHATSSYPDFVELRRATDVFEDVLGYQLFLGQVEREDGAGMLVLGELVTGNYFSMLGIRPAIGRSFAPVEDSVPLAHPVVILGHEFWRTAFGADVSVVGSTIRLNRRPYTVIGVAPSDFNGSFSVLRADVFAPMMMIGHVMAGSIDRLNTRGSRSMFVRGRLREGVSIERAAAAVSTIGQRLAAEYPETNDGRVMTVIASSDVAVHPAVDRALVPVAGLLLSVVGLVLLIACANLASFLLARAADRRKEIAIRLAIGATRAQLIRQLLIESVMLAMAGSLAGVLVAIWTIGVLERFQPPLPIPLNIDVSVDGSVLLFTAVVSVLAGIAFGLAPGIQATRPDLAPTLRDEAGAVTGHKRSARLRNGLVVAQVTVSVLLLVGSGLFLRSLQKAQRIDTGFDTGPAAILSPSFELSGFEDEARIRVVRDRILERIRAMPGITGVAIAGRLPLGAAIQTRELNIDGITPPNGADALDVDFTGADAAYFTVMGVPLVAGRNFGPEDNAAADGVAIISETAARAWWPGDDAIGRTLWLGDNRDHPVTVVGVARDTRVRTLGESPRAYVYLNAQQDATPFTNFIIRGNLPPARLLEEVRRVMLEVEPQLVIMQSMTMDEHLALLLFPPRMAALLLSIFGGLALVLAAVGLYGLVSYAVARRTREVGIRLALGASTRDVLRLMTGSGLRLVFMGGAIGLILAAGGTSLVARFLYGIDALDFVAFAGAPAVLLGVGLLATWIPARRAARLDPQTALRS